MAEHDVVAAQHLDRVPDLPHRRHAGGQDDGAAGGPQLAQQLVVGQGGRGDLVRRHVELLEEVDRLGVPGRGEPVRCPARWRARRSRRTPRRRTRPGAGSRCRSSGPTGCPARCPTGRAGCRPPGVRFWNLTASQPAAAAASIRAMAFASSPLWLMPISPVTYTGRPAPTSRSPIFRTGASRDQDLLGMIMGRDRTAASRHRRPAEPSLDSGFLRDGHFLAPDRDVARHRPFTLRSPSPVPPRHVSRVRFAPGPPLAGRRRAQTAVRPGRTTTFST